MEKNTHCTALISNSNLEKFADNKGYYDLIYSKKCDYNDEYSIIEYIVNSDDPGDADMEVMINTIGALIVHEDGSNAFCLLQEDIEEIGRIYSWPNSGAIAMGDLLSTDDRILLLQKISKKVGNNLPIYYQPGLTKENRPWVPLEDDKGGIFTDDFCNIKFGPNGKIESAWLPALMEQIGGFYFIIQDYDLDDEEEENEYYYNLIHEKDNYNHIGPNDYPWDDDDYYDYEYDYSDRWK